MGTPLKDPWRFFRSFDFEFDAPALLLTMHFQARKSFGLPSGRDFLEGLPENERTCFPTISRVC